MKLEKWDLRVHEASRALPARRGSLAAGDELAAMELGECQGRQDQRVTEGLMAWLVCLVRRGTGVSQVPMAPQGHPERTGRGGMMEKLDPEGCPENLVPEDCLDPRGHQDHQGHRVWPAWMDKLVPKGTWVPRVSRDLQASRATRVLRVFQVHKAPSVPQERRGHWVNLVFLACLVQTVLRVILARKVLLERRGVRVHQALRAPLVIQDHAESRERMVFVG